MCVCVCVFFPFILDIKFVGRTSLGHTEFFIHLPSAVRALIFLTRRIQSSLSLVDCEVEFCVLTIYSFTTRWSFYFYFLIFREKNPVCQARTHVPTCQKVTRLPLSYRGDRLFSRDYEAFGSGEISVKLAKRT